MECSLTPHGAVGSLTRFGVIPFMEYKETLNLPQTDFPMKADLIHREPQRLASWTAGGLYDRIQASRSDRELFLLHDGPPFANGDVHVEHRRKQDSQGLHHQIHHPSGKEGALCAGLGLSWTSH